MLILVMVFNHSNRNSKAGVCLSLHLLLIGSHINSSQALFSKKKKEKAMGSMDHLKNIPLGPKFRHLLLAMYYLDQKYDYLEAC